GDAQSADQRRSRRVREEALIVVLDHVFPRQVAARHLRALVSIKSLLADGKDAESGREHEALLRTGNAAVHAPFTHTHVERADRRYAVDKQKCGMLGSIE